MVLGSFLYCGVVLFCIIGSVLGVVGSGLGLCGCSWCGYVSVVCGWGGVLLGVMDWFVVHVLLLGLRVNGGQCMLEWFNVWLAGLVCAVNVEWWVVSM